MVGVVGSVTRRWVVNDAMDGAYVGDGVLKDESSGVGGDVWCAGRRSEAVDVAVA